METKNARSEKYGMRLKRGSGYDPVREGYDEFPKRIGVRGFYWWRSVGFDKRWCAKAAYSLLLSP